MADPFTIRIFVPDGDPEGVRIIDRLHSTGTFFVFPRTKYEAVKNNSELGEPGIYVLIGYSEGESELPTVYIGQADNIRARVDQHIKGKEFWDKAAVFVSPNKMNSTHARWLEYALIKRADEVKQCILENGNAPQEPKLSAAEKADMTVFFREILQTLPLVGIHVFEFREPIVEAGDSPAKLKNEKDTIIVPAQKEGFERVFLGENAWWAVRISGGMLNKIKYAAAYQTAPVSAITHFAPVERIEPYGEEGKYRLVFSKPATKLERQIPFGDLPQGSMQGTRFTTLELLKKAKTMKDLFNS
jgi:hypothetical protein